MTQRFKQQLRDAVNLMLEAATDHDLSMDKWATKAGLHYNTVWRLVHNVTKLPQWQTVVAMSQAVGIEVYFRRNEASRNKKRGAA